MSLHEDVRRAGEMANGSASLKDNDSRLEVEAAGRTISVVLPGSGEGWDLLDFRHAFPKRARGDQREMLLAAILQDAIPGGPPKRPDGDLRAALMQPGTIPAANDQSRPVLAEVIGDQYWVRPGRRGAGSTRPFAFPFHSSIPANFVQPGRYKLFRGDLLLLFCWNGHKFEAEPIRRLFELLNDREGLNLLDGLLVDAALLTAGEGAHATADPDALLNGPQAKQVLAALHGGAFLQPALDRARADLLAVLEMPLPRHDKVAAVILTLSMNLGIYYYEVATKLGQGLESVVGAAAGRESAETVFAGSLKFRVGIAGDRPIKMTDGCATSWRTVDDRHLISLSPNIVSANLLHLAWQAAGGATESADPGALAAAMRNDKRLATLIDVASAGLAVCYGARTGSTAEDSSAPVGVRPGPHALRAAVLRHRQRTLKHLGRDVVNQLLKRSFGGSLIRVRGKVTFFELDEEFLFLLVKFVLRRGGESHMQFRVFLDGLKLYGLAPQDANEEERLAIALEHLGMLQRFSDAGESVYVRHVL